MRLTLLWRSAYNHLSTLDAGDLPAAPSALPVQGRKERKRGTSCRLERSFNRKPHGKNQLCYVHICFGRPNTRTHTKYRLRANASSDRYLSKTSLCQTKTHAAYPTINSSPRSQSLTTTRILSRCFFCGQQHQSCLTILAPSGFKGERYALVHGCTNAIELTFPTFLELVHGVPGQRALRAGLVALGVGLLAAGVGAPPEAFYGKIKLRST